MSTVWTSRTGAGCTGRTSSSPTGDIFPSERAQAHRSPDVLGTGFTTAFSPLPSPDLPFLPISTPFYKIIVPTVDTLRYDFLVQNLVRVGRPVLLVGPVGTGKTSVAQAALSKLDSTQYTLLTINLSAQVGAVVMGVG